MRKTKFQIGEYYHIYNRGVDKRDIFMDKKDYLRFLISMKEFNTTKVIDSLYRLNQLKTSTNIKVAPKALQNCSALGATSGTPLIKIIVYTLLPNHYHFILKQLTNGGIAKFMQKVGSGYTEYFNNKYNRSGSLFQGTYKSIRITSDEYLVYLSGYINGNAEIHKIAQAENWQWSSYPDYLSLRNGTLCNKQVILNQFKNIKDYKNYVNIIIKESKQRKNEIKKYLLE